MDLISIPFSTIKRMCRYLGGITCNLFQFHLVRLKVRHGYILGYDFYISIPFSTIKS